jgi:uncharacterized protein
MKQIPRLRSILFHLYPGIAITVAFILVTPLIIQQGYPPQMGILLSVALVALPVLVLHLVAAKNKEQLANITTLNGYNRHLPLGKLIMYVLLLLVIAFIIWGITQPLNAWISSRIFNWLPGWYTTQDFKGYEPGKIKLVLVVNLLLNGIAAPFLEELYFRGYLLPRMNAFGKWSFVINTALFSLYHFWQPYIYGTLILSLLPMIYITWKTKDLRVSILTHCLLNIIGAIASFALVLK